jgi:chromosome segregation ATPase
MRSPWRAGIVILFVSVIGCTNLSIYSRNPAELRERAKNLTANAAGTRRSARKYSKMVEKSRKQIDFQKAQLQAYRSKKDKLDGRIQELRKQKRKISEEEADKLQITINSYMDERDAVKAKIDETLVRIQNLKDQIRENTDIKETHLYRSEQMLKRAKQLRKRARQLSTSNQSS